MALRHLRRINQQNRTRFNSLTSRAIYLCSLFLILRELPVAVVTRPREEVSALTEIKLKKGEPVDRALRRLKKKVDREGTLKTIRSRRQYEKPSAVRRRKEKVARFSAMLAARHADD
jgi:small subunit ribosomal protein S21